MVPLKDCNTPTFTVPSAKAGAAVDNMVAASKVAASPDCLKFIFISQMRGFPQCQKELPADGQTPNTAFDVEAWFAVKTERKSLLFCEQKRSKKNFDNFRLCWVSPPVAQNQ
jgi:hypothetical protein